MNTFIIAIIIFTLVLIGSMEVSNRMVYKSLTKDEDIESFMNNMIEKAELNPYEKKIISGLSFGAPYISKSFSITSKWYISDYGRIPRWSKYSKSLDQKYRSLLENYESENFEKYGLK